MDEEPVIKETYPNPEYKYPTCPECDEMIEICICED